MKFTYTCKNKDGQLVQGEIEAPNEAAATKALQTQDLFVLELSSGGGGLPGATKEIKIPFISNRVSLKDKIIFTQQLAMMIKAGLPLIDSFKALEEQTENKYFSKIIAAITIDVKGGKSLSDSFNKYPKIFPPLYISIARSGEKSGKLDEVLGKLAEQLQKDYDLITKIKAAITYPIVVVVALVAIVIIMLIFVVPELKNIFNDMGVQLPLLTRIVLGTSDALRNYWYIFLIIFTGIWLGVRFWKKTSAGRLTWDKFKLRIPLLGPLIKKIYIARFARTMGTLVASGLPLLDIIDTVSGVVNNRVYEDAFKKISKDIENGLPLSEALKKYHVFPAMVYHLVAVGEKSGKLDYILLSMADFFDKEVEASTGNLATLVEPILIIIVGTGVGLVVASVIMPIYSLVNAI
ncbi:MAG: hypothetical protein US94_C0028G0003 [Berkelbacteria bacterium GW2011_GWB1_38_5]|uniref:Type II secretion system protein GspF domain-containing protein n=2 Tax=Candidatus Berkelbacteria TaxID=1618330 RepID=A0A0G0LQN6_9BACT|nr:MAG: hypothetical protein US94_C0028G0003 [Berkelbacteria bacterium GW2011_GWB1_38_5]KKQ90290.1 MAG: hypothetical protein UT15_C0016G0002 [Berkelbacteria bacterium GW2011_GWA1_39_10]